MSDQDPNQLDLEFDPDSNISASSGTDCYTISIDPSIYSSYGSSITSPCVISWGGTGTSTTCWPTSSNYTISSGAFTSPGTVKIDTNGIQMEAGTDIKIGDHSLSEVLSRLEERLNILHHNQELEDKWESLRELGNQYRELEKELIEKEKMWKILKDA
jgi:hypothetical protein